MPRPFHWFGPASVFRLLDDLRAGVVARLEVHQQGDAMTLQVVYAETQEAPARPTPPPINDSHLCPPTCP